MCTSMRGCRRPRRTPTSSSRFEPGTEGVLALGIARLVSAQRAKGVVDSTFAEWTPEEVEKRTGVPAAKVERLANEFAAHGPAVAIIGGAPLAHSNGLFNALAVNSLNRVADSLNQPGGMSFVTQAAPATVARRSPRSCKVRRRRCC